MSGICGVIDFTGAAVDPELLKGMAQAAAHRGPDGVRYHIKANAGLANLALNITPESVYEQQPLLSRQGDLVLTADARIDNRAELIRILSAEGCPPGVHLRVDEAATDAEVILAAYRLWGEECPVHIIGDFAFAIWDVARKRLFAARDAIGSRALYYRSEPRRVLFATEVKQILAAPGVPARVFEPAIGALLAGQGGFNDWTFYEGIAQLPPAHALIVDAAGSRTRRYWDVDPDHHIEYAREEEYAEHFLEVFLEAVRCRLRSVKPVGIYLSGGLDSGSVASTAGWLLQRPQPGDTPSFHPYCWAFDRLTECDERHISDGIVRHYGFPVTYVPADGAWPLKDYPAHGPDRDDPWIGAFQALHEYTLTRARTEGMGSMLTGGYGDLAVGLDLYEYLDQLRTGRWWKMWNGLRAHSRLFGVPTKTVIKHGMWEPFRDLFWTSGKADWLRRGYHRLSRRSDPPKPYPEWVRPEFAERVGLDDLLRESLPRPTMRGLAQRRRYIEFFRSHHTMGLVWGDRLRSRFGLYDADPWNDRRVASFVMAVPPGVLNRSGESKRLVRRAMRGIMPEGVRRTATAILPGSLFYAGVKDRARDTVLDLISDSRAGALGYIDEGVLSKQYAAFVRGEHYDTTFHFTLYVEMWLRKYWS